jgi:hypothetical protein
MSGPSVYEDGLYELSIDPSYNSLDNTFKSIVLNPARTDTADRSLLNIKACLLKGVVLNHFSIFQRVKFI